MGLLIEPNYHFSSVAADAHFASARDFSNAANSDTVIIPIHGFLAHRFAYHVADWATGYDYITGMVAKAEADPFIKTIVFDVNSGGGEVAGAFEAAEFIANSSKRTVAVVDSAAYSAAYLLACACDEIVLSATASAGSIGVVTQHYEVSKALEAQGVKVTYIYAGARKVDGNPYEPLSEEATANIGARISQLYTIFVNHVAKHRNISADAVRATEAGVFLGEEAVRLGLADRIINSSAAYAEITNQPKAETITQEPEMTTQIDQKERIRSIVTSEEANANQNLAQHLAFNTDMGVEEAIELMKVHGVDHKSVAHVEQGLKPDAAFAAAMGVENPEVGASGEDEPKPKAKTQSTFK